MDDLPGEAPRNLEAERAVLGAVLREPALLPRATELLTVDDFDKDAHQEIFRAMVRLDERGEPADVLMVTEELKLAGTLEAAGGPAHLATCMEEATVATQFGAYVQMIRDKARLREVMRLGHDLSTGDLRALARLSELHAERTNGHRPQGPSWPLYDGAEEWSFPAVTELVEHLLPATGIVWWGGLPKRYKSLFALYCSLAIACRRSHVVKRFLVKTFPRILYVSREDGGSRLQQRRDDILSAWTERPEPGAIIFVIRPGLDLLNPEHVAWLRDTCVKLGITMLVLDTWTALSPSADPLGAKDQTQLKDVVVRLCEEINGLVIVVDHSRKNRPDGQPITSADILGPSQKWQAAEHIVMLDLTSDGRRLEVFIEGKDAETRRFFLTVSPKGSGAEKFAYAGTVDEMAEAQRAAGDANRQAVLDTLRANPAGLRTAEIVDALAAAGVPLSRDTVQRHARALAEAGRVVSAGQGPTRRYVAVDVLPQAPCAAVEGAADE